MLKNADPSQSKSASSLSPQWQSWQKAFMMDLCHAIDVSKM
jgi:hypothetical protein